MATSKKESPAAPATMALPRGIRLHRTGTFLVDKTVQGRRVTKTFQDLEEAILFRHNLEAYGLSFLDNLMDESDSCKKRSQTGAWTLKQGYDYAQKTVWLGKASSVTNMHNAKPAFKYFGEDRLLSTIKLKDMDAYVDKLLKAGDTGATVNRKLSCLSVIIRTAFDRGGLGRAELPKFPHRLKESEHRIRFLSPREEETLLSLLYDSDFQGQAEAVKVLLYTGFRCGELWRLEKRDVDLKNHTMTAWQTKNGHPRTIPIVDCIMPVIERRMNEGESDKLFPEGSNPWLRTAWEKAREMMGLTDDAQFVPHCLRHTCATRLSQQGIPLTVIKKWLGHMSIQTTIRYAHFNERDLFIAASHLNETAFY